MKHTIGKKILTVIFIPFLALFVALSLYIGYTITVYVTDWMELEIKGISEINAVDLTGRMRSVEVSVLSAAEALELIDPLSRDARTHADGIVRAMFNNSHIYNSWLAYEPNAFDGKDAEHGADYPGAPKGRFIRSYLMDEGGIVVAPDMDEQTLDDPDESPWYVIPRDSDRLYIDVASDIPNLYDYGVGGEPAYTLSIVAPVHKDGRVIGCVGADVLFDDMTIGIGDARRAAVAVFYPNGRIFYSENLDFAEECVDTLGFTESRRIINAISTGSSLFLPDEYSIFIDERAFTYFQPINIKDEEGGALSLYVAIPRSEAFSALRPVFLLIASIFAATIAGFAAMYLYISSRISKPIRKLTLAADSISKGDLNTEITSFSESKDEVGLLSQSLRRMVEQFRVYISHLRQAQQEMAVHTQVENFMKESVDPSAFFHKLSVILCEQMGFYKATVVYVQIGKALVAASFEYDTDTLETGMDFMYHSQVQELISDKNLLYYNPFAISEQKLEFFSDATLSACILPLWADGFLCGYIILENRDKELPFGVGKESLLIYIAGIVTDWLSKTGNGDANAIPAAQSPALKSEPAEDCVHTPADGAENADIYEASPLPDRLSRLREIDGMNVDAALEAMGGLTDIYERSVGLLVKLLPETAAKLDEAVSGDINAFAIEIHGLKGSLNNIGAMALGSEASEIEKAAKSADVVAANEMYRPFKERLLQLHQDLKGVFDIELAVARLPGDKQNLAATLEKAALSTGSNDAFDALDLLQPLMDFSYGAQLDARLAEVVGLLEIFECDKALAIIHEITGGLQ